MNMPILIQTMNERDHFKQQLFETYNTFKYKLERQSKSNKDLDSALLETEQTLQSHYNSKRSLKNEVKIEEKVAKLEEMLAMRQQEVTTLKTLTS